MMHWIRLIEIRAHHIEWGNLQGLKLLIKNKHWVQDLEIMKKIRNSEARDHSLLCKARINLNLKIWALDQEVMNPILISLKIIWEVFKWVRVIDKKSFLKKLRIYQDQEIMEVHRNKDMMAPNTLWEVEVKVDKNLALDQDSMNQLIIWLKIKQCPMQFQNPWEVK